MPNPTTYAALLRRVRRCMRAEREAEFAVQSLTGWYDHDDADRALAKAKQATDAAMRELARAVLASAEPARGAKGPMELPYACVSVSEPHGKALEWKAPLWEAVSAFKYADTAESRELAVVRVEDAVHVAMRMAIRESAAAPERETATLTERLARAEELLDLAWGVIVDVRDWSGESPEWQAAAVRWRDRYMAGLSQSLDAAARGDRT